MELPEQFEEYFRPATSQIVILGTNPLHPYLEHSGEFFADLLTLNKDLRLTILAESDSENFNQSLCVDHTQAENRISYATLRVHRDRVLGRKKGGADGLLGEIGRALKSTPDSESVLQRVIIRQSNLRHPASVIRTDETLRCAITGADMPTLSSYVELEHESEMGSVLNRMLNWYLSEEGGSKFLSKTGDELIQLYDKEGLPRGIYPRACFYTTAYQRYSIWGFIFNREGQILLHQRSAQTKDGRDLWDKSIGGHVDLGDSSTFITAQRELVEEMFLPEAEFSKYVQADLGDILHFGEWRPEKRPERLLRDNVHELSPSDWVMFRAMDRDGSPMTITRVSDRRLHDSDNNTRIERTMFRSDVYFFLAPPGFLDTERQMKKLLAHAEAAGAAQDHRLVTPNELRDWIVEEESNARDRSTFTDDLLFVNLTQRDLLEEFAAFAKLVGS